MKYQPRKKKELVRSRTKPHNIQVRAVVKNPPDYDKFVRAIILIAEEQLERNKNSSA